MSPGQKLLWDMKVTAGARFNAAHRLASKDKIGNISLALFSGVLFSISVISVAFTLDALVARILSVGGIVASVMMLIMSMKLFADRHAVQAEQMHRCALEINEIRRRYAAEDIEKPPTLRKATEQYNLVLQKYSINHTEADYIKYKLSHKWEFVDIEDQAEFEMYIYEFINSLKQNFFEKISALLGGSQFSGGGRGDNFGPNKPRLRCANL